MERKNNSIHILKIDKDKYGKEYKWIGSGSEGEVYKYDEKLAIKTFRFFNNPEKLKLKLKKIELLTQLNDKNACFPKGFIEENGIINGYYYDLVDTNNNYENFDDNTLLYLKNMRKKLKYIIEAEEAIKRFHNMGIILGDIKEDNIMIDKNNNIKFIDTDNWMYKNYGFDVIPIRANWLSQIYDKEFSQLDNDKFTYAVIAIQLVLRFRFLNLWNFSDEFFKNMIELLEVTKEIKDYLRLIFSDKKDKIYIGDILKNIDKEIITESNREYLRDRRIR